jgi:predicted metal-dependent hydrolase
MVKQSFVYGDDVIEYTVFFAESKPSKISIHVHPNATVQVDAPAGRHLDEIHEAVLKRARWISRHVSDAKKQREHVLPRSYTSGESLFYLGRRYQLKVSLEPEAVSNVKLLRGQLRVETLSRDAGVIKTLVDEWYRARAKEVFQRRFAETVDRVRWVPEVPEWRMLRMKKQWGSCSPNGRILLNPHLVKAPRECIDYVIVHEVCHLKEHNHGSKFYKLLDQMLPSWRPIKARLDGMAELLLNE